MTKREPIRFVLNSEFERDLTGKDTGIRLEPLLNASGGTCNVFTARILGKKVFVKEIKPEFADDARMLAAFKKEAEIGFRLDHRNLPQYVYAEGVLPSERYIVQEFIDGQALPDFIKENPAYFRNRKNLERFIRELADVVDYLHRNQILHLDLKPENILISRIGNTLKLVDLGFCASDFYDNTRGFTHGELAPERLGKPQLRGPGSDYYGIGRILTYIRSHTPRFPKSRYKKLESSLLLPDPSRRISSKEEIEKYLTGGIGKKTVWVAAVSTIAVIALLFIFIGVRNQSGEEGSDTVAVAEFPRVAEESELTIDNADNPPEQPAGRNREDVKTNSGQYHYDGGPNEFPYDSYEKLKAEMRENINTNFADFEKLLNASIRDGHYSEEDYETLTKSYHAAFSRTFDTTPYKSAYPELAPSLIDDTLAEEFEATEKSNWGPAFKEYVRQYHASVSGTSR